MECNVDKKGLGVTECTKLPALIKSMITTPVGFNFTAAQIADPALLEAALQTAILNPASSRIHVWPLFISFENISEAPVYEDTPLAYLAVRDGNYRFRFGIKQSLCLHRAMFTHRASSGRAFLFDAENQLIGTQDAAGNFYGLSIQLLHTEKMMFSDGTVSTKSPILLALANNKELDSDGVLVDASFVNTVDKLTDLLVAVVSATTNEVHVSVTIECDGTPVNGLVLADFEMLTTAGATQTINTVTEVGDGIYRLFKTSGAWVDGTIGLVTPSTLSIQAYEGRAVALDVTS